MSFCPVVFNLSVAKVAADLLAECESARRSLTPNPFWDGPDASCHEPVFCRSRFGKDDTQ